MPHYAAALTLRDARGRYFAANGLGEGGYQDARVRLALGPVRFAFPSTAGRVRAVRYHDLHHVVTGYATDWTGEAVYRLALDREPSASLSDQLHFAGWSAAALALAAASAAPLWLVAWAIGAHFW